MSSSKSAIGRAKTNKKLPSARMGLFCRNLSTAFVAIVIVLFRKSMGSQLGATSVEERSQMRSVHEDCPEISIGECSRWETDTQNWIFVSTDNCTPPSLPAAAATTNPANEEKIYKMPKGPSIPRGLDDVCKNATSVVFYGSSHMRELHLAFVRLKRGLQYLDELEMNLTNVGSGTRLALNPLWAQCDPGKTGWSDAKYGVDMKACGLPGKRLVPELGENIAIGFKTFIHTPEADHIFVNWLQDVGLRYPKVLIADVGVWGARGNKISANLKYTLSLQDEIDDYLKWLRTTFPTTNIVFIAGAAEQHHKVTDPVLAALQSLSDRDPNVHLLRKDLIMARKLPQMECQHGCKGPVLVLLATVLLDWLETLTNSPTKCSLR